MKHTLIVVFSLLLLIFGVAALQAQTTETADTLAGNIAPPAPVTDLRAFDTPDDHGHSITLKWKLSADDGAGAKSVMAYQIQRWNPTFVDTIAMWRDSVTRVTNLLANSRTELNHAKRWLKTNKKSPIQLTIRDSLVFFGDSVRAIVFTETERTIATWRYQPDTLLIYDGIDQVAEATSTEDSSGTRVLVGSVVVTSEAQIFFDPMQPSPTIIHPEAVTKLDVAVGPGGQSYSADSLMLFYGGQSEQVGGTTTALAELSAKIIADSVKYYTDRIAALKEDIPKLEKMIRPLQHQRDSVIALLPSYYAKYPESGAFDSVGTAPAGQDSLLNTGEKEKTSQDYLPDHAPYYYRVLSLTADPAVYSTSEVVGPVESVGQWFNTGRWPVFWAVILFGVFTIYFVTRARQGAELYVRPLGGIEAVDDAIGRATEMGKPILYVLGLGTAADIATIASFTILSRVAKRVAEYQTELIVPTYDPIVMTVAQEVVKSAYLDAGRPDSYNEDIVFFVTQAQFAYVAAVNGIMLRQLPATNVYMGKFFAESLILAETGAVAGSIQISGTDEIAQIPFFIVACDYTLIGEELYAASAYLGREPILLGSLKAQDYAKALFVFLAIIGIVAANFGWTAFTNLFRVTN